MNRHVDRLRRAVRDDPFTAVEALLLAGILGGLVLATLLLALADSFPVAMDGLRAVAIAVLLGPAGMVVLLLGHAGYDLWRFIDAEPGDRFPVAPVAIARAGWRVLETVAVLLYVVLALVSLWIVSDLPETEPASTFFFASAFTVVLATVVLVGIVAVRIVVTLGYRGVRSAVQDA